MKKLGVVCAALFVAFAVSAQDAGPASGAASFGVVIYAEGEVVSIIRDTRRREYDAFTGELLGFPVYPGDIIQTDPATYVEIQLMPSQSVVKVAENTSFTIDQISANGEGVFGLAYGRLRARVGRLTGESPFEIRGIGATAGVRGTDFGTDVTVTPAGGSSLTRIYCFEGEVTVEVHDPPDQVAGVPSAAAEPIVVSANQMVTATTIAPSLAATGPDSPAVSPARLAEGSSGPAVTAVEPVSAAISEFWERQDFVVEPAAAETVLAQFPNLQTDAVNRLGDVPFLQDSSIKPEPVSMEEPVPEPTPTQDTPIPTDVEPVEVSPVDDSPKAQDAVALEADEEPIGPERRERLIGATKATGIVMTGLGVVAEAAAVTFFFWGDQILPSWPPATDPDILTAVAASGGVMLIGGILSLLFSLQLSQ